MVHVRLNEREPNPNPYVNFITALPAAEAATEDARQLLRALAAQLKPVMKTHGFVVNSLEEYEYNRVFAGRNWNNGETVEIVLRSPSGAFQPIAWLMSTLCHELAHIKHMNHGPSFQSLWAQLRREVRELQNRGYYGDGYWSSGQRLVDSARIGGQGIDSGELPEYMCGGAHSRARPSSLRRPRRRTHREGPSNHTGRQTVKKRKAGSRITAKGTFEGNGQALNDDLQEEEAKKVGSGFRKRAGSKRAREERALAAERRLLALQDPVIKPVGIHDPATESESDDDTGHFEPETDQDRKRTLLHSLSSSDAEGLTTSIADFRDDFVFPQSQSSCDVQSLPIKGSAATLEGPSNSKGKGRASQSEAACGSSLQSVSNPRAQRAATLSRPSGTRSLADFFAPSFTASDPGLPPQKKRRITTGGVGKNGTNGRQKQHIGMLDESRRRPGETNAPPESISPRSEATSNLTWPCLICTLANEQGHLACSACGTARGESVWRGHGASV